jgi:hypothetical protein
LRGRVILESRYSNATGFSMRSHLEISAQPQLY